MRGFGSPDLDSGPVLLRVRRAVESAGRVVTDVFAYDTPTGPRARVEVGYPGGSRTVLEVSSEVDVALRGSYGKPRRPRSEEELAELLRESPSDPRPACSNADFRALHAARARVPDALVADASSRLPFGYGSLVSALELVDVLVEEPDARRAVSVLDDLVSGAPLEWVLRRVEGW